MKLDIVKTSVAILIAGLIAWGFYVKSAEVSPNAWLLTVLSGILLAAAGAGCLGISFESKRSGAVVRVCSGLYFFIALAINWIFSGKDFSVHAFIIINMVAFLLFLLIAYSIYKTRL